MSAININKNNFQNEVLNSDKPVLLDFWASWCAPCRMVVPIIEEIASERTRTKRQTIAVMVIVLKLSPLQWERLIWIYHEIEREILNRRL